MLVLGIRIRNLFLDPELFPGTEAGIICKHEKKIINKLIGVGRGTFSRIRNPKKVDAESGSGINHSGLTTLHVCIQDRTFLILRHKPTNKSFIFFKIYYQLGPEGVGKQL